MGGGGGREGVGLQLVSHVSVKETERSRLKQHRREQEG